MAAIAGTILDTARSKRAVKNLKPINLPAPAQAQAAAALWGCSRGRRAVLLPPPNLRQHPSGVGTRPVPAAEPAAEPSRSAPLAGKPAKGLRGRLQRRGESLEAFKFIS